jgi:hypothetical protein
MRVFAMAKRYYITDPNVLIAARKIFLIVPYDNVHISLTNYFPILGVFKSRIIQEAFNGLLVFLLLVIYCSAIK